MARLLERLTQSEIKKAFDVDLQPGRYAICFKDNKVTLSKANRKASREDKNCIMVTENPRSFWDRFGIKSNFDDWSINTESFWKWDPPSQPVQYQSGTTLTIDTMQLAMNQMAERASRQIEETLYVSPRSYYTLQGLQQVTETYSIEQELQAQQRAMEQHQRMSDYSGLWNYQLPVHNNYIVSGIDVANGTITINPEGSVQVTDGQGNDGSID